MILAFGAADGVREERVPSGTSFLLQAAAFEGRLIKCGRVGFNLIEARTFQPTGNFTRSPEREHRDTATSNSRLGVGGYPKSQYKSCELFLVVSEG